MANYSLILNAPFKPFSYQEMVTPILAATQAHQAIEEDYANLATKANVWEEMANEQTDPYAYKMYKTYSEDLASKADQLMQYGLNATSRQDMLNMRARYSKEIAPIENAYKRREELAGEQRKAMAQNPTMLYERYARNMSLDDFIKNPSLDYGNQYSGVMLAQQVGQAAANIAKEARDSEEGRRKLRRILPYQYELVQQHGFSREAVMNAILNSPDADKILTGLVDSAITTSGVGHLDEYGRPTADGWGDLQTRRRAYDYARQGLWNAIGQTQYQMVTDQYGMQSALQAQAARRQAQAAEDAWRASNRLNPVAVRDQHEVSKALPDVNRWLNNKYIIKDPKNPGKYIVSLKGFAAYKEGKAKFETYAPKGLKVTGLDDVDFYLFADNYKGKNNKMYFVTKGGHELLNRHAIDNISAIVKATQEEGSYDIYHTTEYVRQLEDDYGKEVMKQVLGAEPTEGFQKVHFDSKTRTWKVDEHIKGTDLENPIILDMRYSKMGTTAMITTRDSKGKITGTHRILIPQMNINPTVATNLQNSIDNADDFGAILAKGMQPKTYYDTSGNLRYKKDRNGNILYTDTPLSQADIISLQNAQDKELENTGIFGSQLVVPSKTKDEEYEVINF